MSKKRPADHRPEKQSDRWDPEASDGGARSKSNRKHLKEIDRDPQRLIGRISRLEAHPEREDSGDKADLLLEAEELHREALLLRTEIREALDSGRADLDDVVDGIDDSWQLLHETLDELIESFRPSRQRKSRPHAADLDEDELKLELDEDDDEENDLMLGESDDDEELDFEDVDDDDFDDDDSDEFSGEDPRRIHRPRTGPKR